MNAGTVKKKVMSWAETGNGQPPFTSDINKMLIDVLSTSGIEGVRSLDYLHLAEQVTAATAPKPTEIKIEATPARNALANKAQTRFNKQQPQVINNRHLKEEYARKTPIGEPTEMELMQARIDALERVNTMLFEHMSIFEEQLSIVRKEHNLMSRVSNLHATILRESKK